MVCYKKTPWVIYLISLVLAISFVALSLWYGNSLEWSTINNIGCGLFASVFVAFFVDYIHVREEQDWATQRFSYLLKRILDEINTLDATVNITIRGLNLQCEECLLERTLSVIEYGIENDETIVFTILADLKNIGKAARWLHDILLIEEKYSKCMKMSELDTVANCAELISAEKLVKKAFDRALFEESRTKSVLSVDDAALSNPWKAHKEIICQIFSSLKESGADEISRSISGKH